MPPSLFHDSLLPSRSTDQQRAFRENQASRSGPALDAPGSRGKEACAHPGGGMLFLPQKHFRSRHGRFRQMRALLRLHQAGRRYPAQQDAQNEGADLRKRHRAGQCRPEGTEHRMPGPGLIRQGVRRFSVPGRLQDQNGPAHLRLHLRPQAGGGKKDDGAGHRSHPGGKHLDTGFPGRNAHGG